MELSTLIFINDMLTREEEIARKAKDLCYRNWTAALGKEEDSIVKRKQEMYDRASDRWARASTARDDFRQQVWHS